MIAEASVGPAERGDAALPAVLKSAPAEIEKTPVQKREKRKIIASVKDSKISEPASLPVVKKPPIVAKKETGKKLVEKKAKPAKAAAKISTKKKPSLAGPAEETGLNLQALVWSDDPGSCLAVIDDIIVRKGGRVKGFTVANIERNHVIVRKSGKKWKLMFK